MGQIVVTAEAVASKINNMKENESPGVDGISPARISDRFRHARLSLYINLIFIPTQLPSLFSQFPLILTAFSVSSNLIMITIFLHN